MIYKRWIIRDEHGNMYYKYGKLGQHLEQGLYATKGGATNVRNRVIKNKKYWLEVYKKNVADNPTHTHYVAQLEKHEDFLKLTLEVVCVEVEIKI